MQVSHKLLLELALLEYSNQEPDITVMCEDGKLISTSQFLLLFHSELIQNILASTEPGKTISLSLPFPSGSVINLLNILATGQALSDNTEDLIEVNNVVKVLGIAFNGWELGSQSQSNKVKLKKEGFQHSDDDGKIHPVLKPIVKLEPMNDSEVVDEDGLDIESTKETTSNIEPKKIKRKIEDTTVYKPDFSEPKTHLNKRQKKTTEKRNYGNPMCSICGKTFTHPGTLKKHLEQKVCERKLAQENKLKELMRAAVETVKSCSKIESIDISI